MSQSLTRTQAVVLALVVLGALGLGSLGIARIADKQGLWAETTEVSVGFPETHDVGPGTPVRIRGVEAGQVVAVEYPEGDGPGAEVTLRLHIRSEFASRLYADATAQIASIGVFGSKVVAIHPGNPDRGPLASVRLRGLKPFNLDEAVADVRSTAAEIKGLAKEANGTAAEVKAFAADAKATSAEARAFIREVRESDGTLAKLLKDDDLYYDLKDAAGDAKALLKRTDRAVGTVEGEMTNLKGFVSDGRETLRSIRQGTDALARMPVIRGYVEDAVGLLVRPAHGRQRMVYNAADLFRPGTAILNDRGKNHLAAPVSWLAGVRNDQADVVVVSYVDPADPDQTAASALELSKKRSEAVIEYLRSQGVHKLGWTSRRKMTPLGLGTTPSPVVEKEPLPPSHVQVILFTPQ